MILGIGSDLVYIRRIEQALSRFGKRFENRIFTENEQKYARRSENADIKFIASTYAKRFAAKEACAKALNTGFGSGVSWRDIEIVNSAGGAPEIQITGGALKILQKITPGGTIAKIFVSLSDEYPYAQAYVIIDSVATGS
jgi:holo-[acyl-carrier protein] synthase